MFEVSGLTALREKELTTLLRYLHRGELDVPLTIKTLTRIGLQHRHDVVMGALRARRCWGTCGAGLCSWRNECKTGRTSKLKLLIQARTRRASSGSFFCPP